MDVEPSTNESIDVDADMSKTEGENQEAKETALRDIPSPKPSPKGYKRCTVPGKTTTRSIVYEHGVRFEQDRPEPDPKKQTPWR